MMEDAVVSALSSAASAKQFDAMRQLLENSRTPHGEGPQFRYWEGVLAAREGRLQDALGLLEDAAHRAPRIPAPRYELGNVLASLGRLKEASDAFESAIMLNTNFVSAWINLSAARLRMKDLPRAERAIATAMNLDPNRVETWITLAKVQEEKQPSRAIDTMQEMRRRFGPEPARDAELLQMLVKHDKKHQAIELLEATLKRDPSDAIAKHMLTALTGVSPARADDAYIRELFDDYATRYEQHMVRDMGYLAHAAIAEAVREHLHAPASVLDLGCGTGLMATVLPGYALTGVDLSPEMLKIAETRGYAALHCLEIGAFLSAETSSNFQAIVASDTLIYFGELMSLFAASKKRLSSRGLICINVETSESTREFALMPSGRFAHSADYLRKCCLSAGFNVLSINAISPRKEGGKEVQGLLLVAQRQD